jgi:hypothetical protein
MGSFIIRIREVGCFMKNASWLAGIVVFSLVVPGCKDGSTSQSKTGSQVASETKSSDKSAGGDREAKIKANLARLSPEDHQAAEEQKYCAVEEDNRLGSMGAPIKIMIMDKPVFLCCKGCVKDAKSHPDETLAKVKELKEKAK